MKQPECKTCKIPILVYKLTIEQLNKMGPFCSKSCYDKYLMEKTNEITN